MTHASLFDVFLIFGVPLLLWYLVLDPLVEKWKTVRGLTGLTFVPKRCPTCGARAPCPSCEPEES